MPKAHPTQQPLLHELYASRIDLCNAALAATRDVPEALSHSAFLYYIARYLVAVYEAHWFELPTQVWNDYRNALDHFMRHVAAVGDDGVIYKKSAHLQKMEGHLQRAVLDVSKMLCVREDEAIAEELKYWGADVLDLVDGGDFRRQVLDARHEATTLMERAKVADFSLGHDAAVNTAIVERFLDAVFCVAELRNGFRQKHLVLSNAKRQLATHDDRREAIIEQARSDLRPSAMKRAFWVGVAASFVVSLPLTFLGWWLGVTSAPQTPPKSTVAAQPDSEK